MLGYVSSLKHENKQGFFPKLENPEKTLIITPGVTVSDISDGITLLLSFMLLVAPVLFHLI